MFERIRDQDEWLVASWNELGVGAPTLIALAHLCSRAMLNPTVTPAELTPEAKAILYAARERGVLEVKANNAAYESPSRLLTVFVELADGSRICFRDRDPRQHVRFLEGFGQLCAGALVIHHLYHEFSLSTAGFACAQSIEPTGIQNLLDLRRPDGPE